MNNAKNTDGKKLRKNLPKSKALRNDVWAMRAGNGAATAGCQTLKCPTRLDASCHCV